MSLATCNHLQTHFPHTHTHSPHTHTHTHTFPSPHDAQAQLHGIFDDQRHSTGAACVQFCCGASRRLAVAVQVTLLGYVAADATDSAAMATALAAVIGALRRPRAAS